MSAAKRKYKPYPKYKDSGVEWLGRVPEHWDVKKIAHMTPVLRGASPRPIADPKYFDDNGEYGWVRIEDVTASNGVLYETKQKLSELGASLSVKLEPGVLFLSIAGSVGKKCVSGIKCCIHDGFVYFPHIKEFSFWLSRVFDSGEAFGGLGKLGTQLNLNTETVGNIRLAYPPEVGERNSVLDFIERECGRMDKLVEKKQEFIALLKEKRQALITHAVTKGLDPKAAMKDSGVEWLGKVPKHWDVKRLKYLVRLQSGNFITSDFIQELGDYPVYGGNGMRGYTNEFTHEGEHLLIGRQGALCGNVNYASGKFWASEHAVVGNPVSKFDTFWLGELLRIMDLNQYSVSAAQPGLAVERIASLLVPVPPVREQNVISDHLKRETTRIDRLIAKTIESIDLLKERKTALITAAVTGQIDVSQSA